MNEQVVSLGKDFKLNAVVSVPDRVEESAEAFVILNSGLMHKIGTCRTSVLLARQVANTGRVALRFDLSGIGDSAPRSVGSSDDDRVFEEVQAAMDYLEAHFGVKRFILYGLCSGSQNSFKASLRDDRIVGLVSIDGYSYPTLKFYANHYLPRMLKWQVWKNFFAKLLFKKRNDAQAQLVTASAADATNSNSEIDLDLDVEAENVWPPFPPRKFVEDGYQQLVERGVRLKVIYTGSWFEVYNYKDQFLDMYSAVNFGESLELGLFPEASHIMSEPKHRDEMLGEIIAWLERK